MPEEAQLPPADRMKRVERILEGLLGVMNQPPPPPPAVIIGQPMAEMNIKDFQKMKPPTFEGGVLIR